MSCTTTTTPETSSHWVTNEGRAGVIIFIHGVIGDADGTWRNKHATMSWPEMIAQDADFNSNDVYVVAYPTPRMQRGPNIEEIAQSFVRQLYDQKLMSRSRIYFIAHSMGGLIVKRALNILDRPSGIADLRRIRAVLLLSTPSQGAPAAELGKLISMNPQFGDMTPSDVNSFLQSVENDSDDMLRARDLAGDRYPRIFCAYETLPTHGVHIVSRVYATTRCDQNPYPMNYDHVQIVKPRDVMSDPYLWAKARLQEADKQSNAANPP